MKSKYLQVRETTKYSQHISESQDVYSLPSNLSSSRISNTLLCKADQYLKTRMETFDGQNS